jgi:phosphate uptake regulator
MWKEIISLFRSAGPLQEAFDEALLMLRTSHEMFDDAVRALHGEGAMEMDIYERDRQLNKYERSVRRKIVTHMSVNTKPDINLGLVLTAIVIDIERIGDYTKNIVELASGVEGPFDGLELHDDVVGIERTLQEMFDDIGPALEKSDVTLARSIMEAHATVAETVERCVVPEAGERPPEERGHQRREPVPPHRVPGEDRPRRLDGTGHPYFLAETGSGTYYVPHSM